jgi:hypothetical protein
VFLINSRLDLFTAAPSCSSRKTITIMGHPFSRSYGVILPSSLTRILSNTLGYSPRLPVSVCSTVCYIVKTLRSYFLALSITGLLKLGFSSYASDYMKCGFAYISSYTHSTGCPTPVSGAPTRHSITIYNRFRNINLIPISYSSSLDSP